MVLENMWICRFTPGFLQPERGVTPFACSIMSVFGCPRPMVLLEGDKLTYPSLTDSLRQAILFEFFKQFSENPAFGLCFSFPFWPCSPPRV